MSRRLYLDLDGVMADFDGTFPAVFGLDHRNMADDDMWLKINGHPSFFRDLPPMAGAVEFFRTIEHLDPIILTACPKSNYAHVATQKVEWVRAHLSAHVTVLPVLGGSSKPLFMHAKGDILIDDFRRNTEAWAAAGGHAILHRGFDGTAAALGEAIGSYARAPAQPVEAVDVTEQMVHDALYARAGEWSVIQLFQDAEEAPDIMRIALRAGLRTALAHPRPTGAGIGTHAVIAEIAEAVKADRYVSDTDLASGVFGPAMLAFARKVASEYLSRPTAPTVEQAGEVVWPKKMQDRADGSHVYGSGYKAALKDASDYLAAQPRPVGETVVLDAPALVGHTQFGKGIPWSTVIGCAQRHYQHKDDPKPTPEQIAEFREALLAAAPAPGKGGEA